MLLCCDAVIGVDRDNIIRRSMMSPEEEMMGSEDNKDVKFLKL